MEQAIKEKFDSYPQKARAALKRVRKLILNTGKGCDAGSVTEVLKWNETSYVTENGSTVRIGCRSEHPSKYYVFFHCQTSLVETFKEIYGDTFTFEGKRAMVFEVDDEFPNKEFIHCVSLALRYHKLKHLPLLGA